MDPRICPLKLRLHPTRIVYRKFDLLRTPSAYHQSFNHFAYLKCTGRKKVFYSNASEVIILLHLHWKFIQIAFSRWHNSSFLHYFINAGSHIGLSNETCHIMTWHRCALSKVESREAKTHIMACFTAHISTSIKSSPSLGVEGFDRTTACTQTPGKRSESLYIWPAPALQCACSPCKRKSFVAQLAQNILHAAHDQSTWADKLHIQFFQSMLLQAEWRALRWSGTWVYGGRLMEVFSCRLSVRPSYIIFI